MDDSVKEKFDRYPEAARKQLLKVRAIIYDIAKEESLGELVENLKWNEPSYLSKQGSAIRIDWKEKSPSTFSIYVNCKTSLIDTFREIYQDTFVFSGNREIIFQIDDELPLAELKACISMALRYQKIKNLPLLGE